MKNTAESATHIDQIVFATSSSRKSLLFGQYVADQPHEFVTNQLTAKGLDLRNYNITDFHAQLEQQIPNGDNHLLQNAKFELGSMVGVPVFVQAQRGENEVTVTAQTESHNKVKDVLPSYQGAPVIIFSSDVVSENENSDAKLGKPYKHPDFPRNNPSQLELQQFQDHYLETYFKAGTVVKHVHAFSMIHGVTNEQVDYVATIVQKIPDNVRDIIKHFYIYSGGAGIAQQLVHWQDQVIDDITDRVMKAHFVEMDEERRKELFYLHLIGVPSWQVVPAIRALTEPNRNSIYMSMYT